MRLAQDGHGNLPLRTESGVAGTDLDQIWLYTTPTLLLAPKVATVSHVRVLTGERKLQTPP